MTSGFSLDPANGFDYDFLSEPTSPILTESDLFQYSEHLSSTPSDDFFDYSSANEPSTIQNHFLEYSDPPEPTVSASGPNHTLAQPNRLDTPNDLWYNGENPMVLFQVEGQDFQLPHKPLSDKSLVFRQFMSSPHSVSDLFERGPDHQLSGYPRIVFLGVSNEEATYFFRALYDAEFFEGPPHRTELDVVLAVFKLSTIYKVQFLRQRALAHLNLAFPSGELGEWDVRFEEGMTTFPIERAAEAENIGGTPSPSHTLSRTLQILDLCLTYDAPWILPTAFYEASQYNLDCLLNHPKWQDGSLTEDLKNTILLGYYNHRQESSQVLQFLHTAPLKICTNDPTCFQFRQKSLKSIYTDTSNSRPMQDYLGQLWNADDWNEMLGNSTCDSCYRICKARHEYDRDEAWKRLPAVYGLPSWDVLRQRRDTTV